MRNGNDDKNSGNDSKTITTQIKTSKHAATNNDTRKLIVGCMEKSRKQKQKC
jgi:hypothetical protein